MTVAADRFEPDVALPAAVAVGVRVVVERMGATKRAGFDLDGLVVRGRSLIVEAQAAVARLDAFEASSSGVRTRMKVWPFFWQMRMSG